MSELDSEPHLTTCRGGWTFLDIVVSLGNGWDSSQEETKSEEGVVGWGWGAEVGDNLPGQ